MDVGIEGQTGLDGLTVRQVAKQHHGLVELAKLQTELSTDFGLIMAGAALGSVPIIICISPEYDKGASKRTLTRL